MSPTHPPTPPAPRPNPHPGKDYIAETNGKSPLRKPTRPSENHFVTSPFGTKAKFGGQPRASAIPPKTVARYPDPLYWRTTPRRSRCCQLRHRQNTVYVAAVIVHCTCIPSSHRAARANHPDDTQDVSIRLNDALAPEFAHQPLPDTGGTLTPRTPAKCQLGDPARLRPEPCLCPRVCPAPARQRGYSVSKTTPTDPSFICKANSRSRSHNHQHPKLPTT